MAKTRKIEAWRLTQRARVDTAFSGIGAKRTGGRWNPRGTAVVYASSSIALAALEILVHVEDQSLLDLYVPIPVRFPQSFVAPVERLPKDWRADPPSETTRELGRAFVEAGEQPVLRVPSAVVTAESNYLLNPGHPRFGKIERGEPLWDFTFDARLAAR
ncbi:MAG: RES family NAD+ phosphorylase [Acidobacteriota bacterium]